MTQRADKIDDLFLAYGLKNAMASAQRKCKRRNLLTRLRKLVEGRNEIAHGGDLNDHGKLRRVDARDTHARIVDVMKLVAAFEEILAERTGL